MPLFNPPAPVPWLLNEAVTATGSAFTLTINTVFLVLVEVDAPCTCTGIRYKTGTFTGNSDVGIYDSGGNLLGHSGATANTGALQTLSFLTAVALTPGRYSLAIVSSNGTDTYQGGTGIIAGTSPAYTATNTASAGVLPATTGTLVVDSHRIAMVGMISGGAP